MRSKKLALSLNLIVVLALAFVLILPCLFVGASNDAAYAAAGNYYASITANKGTALLGQLHDLIVRTHTTYTSYDDCKGSKVQKTDPGPNGGVMEFYTQQSIKSFSGTVGTWNREHVWCQSLSGGLWGTSGGGSDMHHIRPSEASLNSTRGNNKYGELNGRGTQAWSKDTNKNNVALGGYVGSGIFEPLDNVKGDVARIVMYVYTHYNNASNVGGTIEASKSHGNLPITNVISASSSDAAWQMLLRWNKLDPVDDIERTRNEAVYGIQGNRNPFIDNEIYADAIWGNGAVEDVELNGLNITPNSVNLIAGEKQILTVQPNPSNANASVNWTSSNMGVATVDNGVVTAKSAGTSTITATSVSNPSIKATATVTVKAAASLELIGEPYKKIYEAGQNFDPTGLTVKLTYSDGSYETYSSQQELAKFSWTDASTGHTSLSANATKIKCKYGNAEVTSDWSITIKALDRIEILGEPNKKVYDVGERFDPTGLTVRAHYNDGTMIDFSSTNELNSFIWVDSVRDSVLLDKDTATIKCKYGNLSVVSAWKVTVRYATSIEVSGEPATRVYQSGQSFNPLGVTVKLIYSDGSFREFTTADDLKTFIWTDAETDSEILMQSTVKIKVKYQNLSQIGNWIITVAAPPETVSAFINSVVAIQGQTTLQARFNAIKAALAEYEKLSSADKANAGAAGAYETLQQAISDYNADVADNNEMMKNATSAGAYAICGVTLAAAALITVLNRKFN